MDGLAIGGQAVPKGEGAPFAPHHRWDRNFYLIFVGLIWLAMISGFGWDMAQKAGRGALSYPLIVHAHALVFVGWLALLTVQLFLIRRGDRETHKRLGLLALGMVPLMAILGPATVIIVDHQTFGQPHTLPPQFMSTQFTNVIGSSVLILCGILFRRDAAAHKRLMLMGTVALTEPGFSRLMANQLHGWLHDGFWQHMVTIYIGSLVLMVVFGAYDFITRKRLHPAYIAAVAWCVLNEAVASWLFYLPAWAAFTRHLIGH